MQDKEKDLVLKQEITALEQKNAKELAYYKGLRDMGVDLTQVLAAKYAAETQSAKQAQDRKKWYHCSYLRSFTLKTA